MLFLNKALVECLRSDGSDFCGRDVLYGDVFAGGGDIAVNCNCGGGFFVDSSSVTAVT